jgi:hypothetical protein
MTSWMWLQILTASPLEMLVDRCGTAVDKWLTGSAAKDYDRQQRHVEAWNFRHCLAGDRLQVSDHIDRRFDHGQNLGFAFFPSR